jgi:uncharacterized protein (DUF488 family)
MISVYTIGFTKKSAETFFGLIKKNMVSTIIDIRLNNSSQLAGFAKKDDLMYFLRELCSTKYIYIPEFAPTQDILKAYKNNEMSWHTYEDQYLKLIESRNAEKILTNEALNNSCFLCSEHEPQFCHRRLAVDFLNRTNNNNLKIKHLM